jgi:hypothetical protein
MDTTGWTTHCFGRFLVDLPPQAQVSATYKIWGDEIKRLHETPTSLAAKLDQREQELKAAAHETQGSMFVRRIEQGRSTTFLSWDPDLPGDTSFQRMDTYLVATNDWRVFQYSGGLSTEKQYSALNLAESLAHNIRARGPTEIPVGPGFCIDSGYIAGHAYQSESVRAGIKLPDYPGLQMSFWSSTGATETGLLERVGTFFQTAVAGPVLGIKTLRKGERNVGPIRAEEYLSAASDQGQRVYAFKWESRGKEESLAHPTLSLEFNVLERDTDDEGKPPPPVFRSDQEALELWDAIIESIRLRPGAV